MPGLCGGRKDGHLKRLATKGKVLLSIFPFLVILDQWTKVLIESKFFLHESFPIVRGFFDITYVRNTGAAFGMMAQMNPAFRVPFFYIVPVTALVLIGVYFSRIPKGNIKLAVALSLVISGAVGNLIDRIRLGYVVDFLSFHWDYRAQFPAFNVADSAICVGVGLLLLDMLREPHASHSR